jgi:LacI family transcriptional regulator
VANTKRISIKDVARRANVSITTVSRVINKVPTVDSKNVKVVEDAIAELKYRPNINARRLVSGANNTIGLIIPSYPGIFYSFFAIEIIRGVGHACESLQLDMVFHISDGAKNFNSHFLEGIIFADIIENRRQVQAAVAQNIPCMVVNNLVQDMDVNYIAINNMKGGRLVAEYLTGLGHKKIATITGNVKTQAGFDRFDGFMKGLDEAKVTIPKDYVFRGDYSRRCARTAIFAQSDDMALEVIAVANEKGLNVPNDVSVVGFDDNPQALYASVGLTTIRQPLFEIAEKATRVLHEIMNGKREERYKSVVDPELVLRDSCAPLKA